MKQTAIDWTFRAGVAALAFVVPLAACAGRATTDPAQAASPCTYVGRLMDAAHVGFDAKRIAELAAYDASGNLVAKSKTFYKADSRRNFALRIPMASKVVDGALTSGSVVRLMVTEPNGTVWSGVVVDKDAMLGGPGSVKEVDIVLAECTNEYGIDDYLLEDLYWEWLYSDYYKPGESFDPSDCLTIVSFRRADQDPGAKDVLTFECRPGRSYRLEVTDSLENPNWQPMEFSKDENGVPINYINVPATGSSEETPTVYLLPQTGPKAFFRIKAD